MITQKDADTYYYLNDSPYDERIISKEECMNWVQSSAIGITLKRKPIDEKDVLRQFCDKLNSDDSARRYQLKSVNENSLLQLRDALGIIRVMRRRNYYFISEYVDADFMNEYLKGLDSKYIKLEYRRLRKTAIDMDFINEFTSELIKDDIDITNKIKEKNRRKNMLGKIVNEIKKLVNNGIDANITEETSLVELGIDSLMTVELVLWLEDAFNIQFNDSDLEMENLRNVRDIVNLVNKYIEQC